ncbi:MAG TPA: M20/M25/M40 family metallo-hydrolase [Roseiflexaceae bacterium]|nr:M20/M25/M40 family metallo-hydrolase [Roseiflexaceae bacterium]
MNTERLLELAGTMVAIPSPTGREQQIADWAEAHFRAIGLQGVRRLPVAEAGDTIVGWIDGPADGPSILINFHLDTFDVFDGWEGDPFTPRRVGNRLYGLGSHDMKGGAACALGAVEQLIKDGTRLRGRVIVAGTTDEENWSRGAHALIDSGLLQGCIACLVPEPSAAGTLTIGQRGRHVFRLHFAGKTVHAAFGGGINAVADAARVVGRLADTDIRSLGYDPQFDMTGSMAVIGMHGGGTLILVPEHADVYIDRHILPGQTLAEAAEQIRAIVADTEIESRWELSWDDRPTPAPGPFVVPIESDLVQIVTRHLGQQQGLPIRHVLGRSVADTNHFAVHGGIPTLICGPQGGNTCEANEYVDIDTLLPIARTYLHSVYDLLGR